MCEPLLDHVSAPGGEAVPDEQGKLPICTRCALAKAIVDGLYKGIYLPGESIDEGMLLRFSKLTKIKTGQLLMFWSTGTFKQDSIAFMLNIFILIGT